VQVLGRESNQTDAELEEAKRYNFTPQQILDIRRHCKQMAYTLKKEQNEELIELSVKSTDFHHRIAAAFCYGMTKNPSNCLFVLMTDRHPLVSQAAREACVSIAWGHGDTRADFGPVLNADQAMKSDAANLWQSYFENKIKKRSESMNSDKEPKAKSVQEVLGLKE
jgi:hypothetical protein